jgi:GH24 family phage-related lysozyme (muramidase)
MTILTVSQLAIDKIIYYEVTSESVYNQLFKHPDWPGGDSGVTIGVGYDIGYHTEAEIRRDWGAYLTCDTIGRIAHYAGIQGVRALKGTQLIKDIAIPFEAAKSVFMTCSMRKAANSMLSVYKGVEQLRPDAAGGMLSLCFNRGCKIKDEPEDALQRRREMRALVPLIAAKDYAGMNKQILAMKRLWSAKTMNGLLLRRDWEAAMMVTGKEVSSYSHPEKELVHITVG